MILSRVELFNFKSFADKTTFDFSSGITAILGPNGCGKSNVVDAIKWVLGEQNPRTLRGEEMTDVIFAGSENRRSSGMAEVSLFFDNSNGLLPTDYNEVCITRRLYRSGESEYLINKNLCRLRDVREMFMDTGIGTSAYSFIEQGKVEALLSAKPHERRLVFEEAAGISKYKARRKESLSRLERTDQNLLRSNDIVEEIEKRIRSLSRQASNARRFQNLSEELRKAKGEFFIAKWTAEREKIEELRGQIEKLEALHREEAARNGNLNNEISELQTRELGREAEIEISTQQLRAVEQETSGIESDKVRTEERLKALEREDGQIKSMLDSLRVRLDAMGSEKTKFAARREALREEVEALAGKLAEANTNCEAASASIANAESELESARKARTALLEERSNLTSSMGRLESEAAGQKQRHEAIESRRDTLKSRETGLADEVAGKQEHSSRLAQKEATLRQELASTRSTLETCRNEGEQHGKDLSLEERRRSALEGRLNTLRELEENMAGVYKGVKAAISAKQNGVHQCAEIEGLVADIFTAPEKTALAIETALGGAQQNIITRTASGARDAISYLKQERAGRATFLPLDNLRPRNRVQSYVRELPGVIGEAIDLANFDEKYRPAAEYLLAGVLVIDTLDQALSLHQGKAAGIRLVTLEGDIINPSGAMTGGRDNSNKGGLITRKSEITALEGQLEAISARISELAANREADDQRINEAAGIARQAEETLTSLEQERREADSLLSGQASELGAIRQELQTLEQELASMAARSTEITSLLDELATTSTALTVREEEAEMVVEALAPKLNNARREAAEKTEELTVLKVLHAEKVQEYKNLEHSIETLSRDISERQRETEDCLRRADEAAKEHTSLLSTREELVEKLGEALSRQEVKETESKRLRELLGNLRTDIEARRSEERACSKRLADILESINKLKLSERESAVHIEGIEEKALEDLQVEDMAAFAVEAAAEKEAEVIEGEEEGVAVETEAEGDSAPQEIPQLDLKGMEKLVTELQEKIRRLGPVNHEAIEELSTLKERRDFLVAQRDDLAAARDDIQALITRLNKECSTRFDETFLAVKENFHTLFRQLFGGGKADLILEESEDPLNAGIEIIARPPGKEPSTISLLSGGEKALCAVALLFAIFRSKPSPFCILDEVDGPLDESNIDRYMRTLGEFTSDSQFIIITHSKRTMSMVDVIYGVTQSEPGVSKKMSLRFAGNEEADQTGVGVA